MRTDHHWLHQKLVAFARTNGLKAAARDFGCSRNTVRKWLSRYQPGTPSSLAGQNRRPQHYCPHRIPSSLEGQIVKLRRQTGFGAQRFQLESPLLCSHNAIVRVLLTHQLVGPRKKKLATQNLNATAPALAGAVLNWRPLKLAQCHHFYLPNPNRQSHDVPNFP